MKSENPCKNRFDTKEKIQNKEYSYKDLIHAINYYGKNAASKKRGIEMR